LVRSRLKQPLDLFFDERLARVGTTSHTTCSTTSRDSDRTASTCALLRPKPPSLPAKSAGKAAAAGLAEAAAGATIGGADAPGDEPTSIAGALVMVERAGAIGCAGATAAGAGDAGMIGLGVEP